MVNYRFLRNYIPKCQEKATDWITAVFVQVSAGQWGCLAWMVCTESEKGSNAQLLLLDQKILFMLTVFSSSLGVGAFTNISIRCKQRSNHLTIIKDLNVIFLNWVKYAEVLVSSLFFFFQPPCLFLLLLFIFFFPVPSCKVSVSTLSPVLSVIWHIQH